MSLPAGRRGNFERETLLPFFDAGVHEVRLVFNEPDKERLLKSLRAVAPA